MKKWNRCAICDTRLKWGEDLHPECARETLLSFAHALQLLAQAARMEDKNLTLAADWMLRNGSDKWFRLSDAARFVKEELR